MSSASEGTAAESGLAEVSLQLLGGFELRIDGERRQLAPACQRLIACLAISPSGQTRARMAGFMWPDNDERRASANLRGVVWRLPVEVRDQLVTSGSLMRVGDRWQIDLVRAHRLGEGVQVNGDPAVLDVDLFEHDLLPGWYDEWIVTEQERHRHFRLNVLESMAIRYLHAGDPGTAVDLCLSVIGVEPLRESAQSVLISAYLHQGNRAMASRQFGRFRDQLRRDLGVEPSEDLRALLGALAAT